MDVARVALALSDSTRLEILDRLAAGRGQACCSPLNPDVPEGVCACDLLPFFDGVGQSRLAYHMKVLRDAGLVHHRRRGRCVYYTLSEDGFRAFLEELQRRYLAAPDPELVIPVRAAAGPAGGGYRPARPPAASPPEGGAAS